VDISKVGRIKRVFTATREQPFFLVAAGTDIVDPRVQKTLSRAKHMRAAYAFTGHRIIAYT